MQKVININSKIRKYLAKHFEQFYNQTNDKTEALSLYSEFVSDLKLEKGEKFYQMILSLCFADACRLLHFHNLYNTLSQEYQELLSQIDQFENFGEIEEILMENPQYFTMLIQAPLKVESLSRRNQAIMLIMGQKVTNNFDTFHQLEMEATFRKKSLEEIRQSYERHRLEGERKALKNAFEQIIILSIGDIHHFEKVLLSLIKEFYKLCKAIELYSFINLPDLGKNVIYMLENGSVDDILYEFAFDDELIEEMLMIYLSLIPLYETTYEDVYKTEVPESVKRKLKEI